jgi:hypothetical protein
MYEAFIVVMWGIINFCQKICGARKMNFLLSTEFCLELTNPESITTHLRDLDSLLFGSILMLVV